MISAILGIILIAVLSSLFSVFGLVIGAGIGIVGVWMSYKSQDQRGLYNKTRNENELHIIPSHFKNLSFNKKIRS